MKYTPFDWYDDPLFYDIVFDEGTDIEAAFIRAAHERYGRSEGRRLLEPACGSGRLIAAMVREGYDVTGFDLSDGMIDFARRRLRREGVAARVVNARMESFSFRERFDVAHCLVSTFRHLLTEEDARDHLRCVARALVPGGIYVLGLHLCEYEQTGVSRERWTGSRDGIDVVCNIQSWPPDRRRRTERVRSRLVVTSGEQVRRLETHWHFRTYGLRQLQSLLHSVPELELAATHDFGYDVDRPIELDGWSIDNVLILRKRSR